MAPAWVRRGMTASCLAKAKALAGPSIRCQGRAVTPERPCDHWITVTAMAPSAPWVMAWMISGERNAAARPSACWEYSSWSTL